MSENIDEKKLVTMDVFEKYHEMLVDYINIHDQLMLEGEATCPKCGATINSYPCENCSMKE
jgi:hypothetical protein